MMTSLLTFTGLFKIFQLIFTVLWSGWARFFLSSTVPAVFFFRPMGTVPGVPNTIDITVTFMLQRCTIFLCLRFLSFSICGSLQQQNRWGHKFGFLIQDQVFPPGLGDPFVFQNPREFYASRSLVWAYNIYQHGQILISCTISRELYFSPDHVYYHYNYYYFTPGSNFLVLILARYNLSVSSNFDMYHDSQWINPLIHSYLSFHTHSKNLQHLFIIWLIVSFLLLTQVTLERIIIITIILLLWEIFPPALADKLLLEFEWEQVSSSFQDSSQYSGRSKTML